MKKYKVRIADGLLQRRLAASGAVQIIGPKWVGKTTTAEQIAKSVLYMSDPKNRRQNMMLADADPSQLLKGETPRLIDEWQVAPQIWDAARYEIDHRKQHGQFILTGSVTVRERDDDGVKQIFHSGAGRISKLVMRPMSLWESGESTGSVSLADLFNAPETVEGTNKLGFEDISFLVCRGGWPDAVGRSRGVSLDEASSYVDVVVESDLEETDSVRRNPDRVRRLLKSYARNQGTQASLSTLYDDMRANENATFSTDTISSYLNALRNIYVIEDMPAWNPNLRSKTAIRTSDNRYFVDPSIAAAVLGIAPDDFASDVKTLGFLFETMCVRDLRVYADSIDGKVYHYRDKDKLECDAVVHLRNGKYGLVEIKLGGDRAIEEGASNLKTLAAKIDTKRMNNPSFMMVLTGVGDYAFRRPDGVYVVPLGCLKD